MSDRTRMTFTICDLCGGRLSIRSELLDAVRVVGGSMPCPCARSSTPGLAATGLTLSQLDRLADIERTLAGDPGLPTDRQKEILAKLSNRLRDAWLRRWSAVVPTEGAIHGHEHG